MTQEYTGQQKDLCYLGPWWREILQFDATGAGGPTVAERTDAIVAVSNVGDDPNWTGHKLAQSNLYAFGRLAWDPSADPVSLLHEWAAATFAMDDRIRSELVSIMADTWRTYERYTAPLGVGFMVSPETHYGPNVNGYEYSARGTYHFADRNGVGVDRTVATGSGFTGQYPEPLASRYENVYTCPDELLLFFHHVPYDHVLQNGRTVLQHIYDTHFQGYDEVTVDAVPVEGHRRPLRARGPREHHLPAGGAARQRRRMAGPGEHLLLPSQRHPGRRRPHDLPVGWPKVSTLEVRVSRRMTIAKIAEQAGVSVPTVSKVLNGRADVAAETRARVEGIIQEHGYRRRTASTASSPMIDLVFPELSGEWAIQLIRGVEGVLRAEGVELVLSECGDTRRPRQEWIESVLNRRPLGVIMVFSDLDADQRAQLEARRIPFVVVDPVGDEGDDVPSIGSANWNGGRMATLHLRKLGHTRIGMIGGPIETLCSRMRVDGYQDALRSTGVAVDPELIRAGDFGVGGGYAEALALLRRPERPTAIFAGSDMQALGVYQAARELGLEIPRDLSVVGYDDLPVAQWVGPTLTTVHQPLLRMAELAARLVLDLARGITPAALRMDLAVEMRIRQSTAAPLG